MRARINGAAPRNDAASSESHAGLAIHALEVPSPFQLAGTTMVSVQYTLSDHATDAPVIDVECPLRFDAWAPPRRASFLAGRACAMLALRRAGVVVPAALPIGPTQGPIWPEGVVGSITHSASFASAIVGASDRFRGIGIDSETALLAAVAEDIASAIAPEWTGHDADMVPDAEGRLAALTALFLAKESLYKCVRPLANDFIDFSDARMTALDVAGRWGRLRLERAFGPAVPLGLELPILFATLHGHEHALAVWAASDDGR